MNRGTFTEDVTQHLPQLDRLLRSLVDREAHVLEIGSHEGLSSCFFLWRLPRANLTCVENFQGTVLGGHPKPDESEPRFDVNVIDATRVRKIVGDSRGVLVDLLDEEPRFDFVYVDGSHFGLDVLIDGALSWRLLQVGGTIALEDALRRQ